GLDLKVQSLLATGDGEWHALIPLRGVRDPARLRSLAEGLPAETRAGFLGLKAESDRLIGGYRSQALALAGLGALAIALLLCIGLRGVREALQVMLPVYAAIAMTIACFMLLGIGLSLFHLVSLLLVLGIGLLYSAPDAHPVLRQALRGAPGADRDARRLGAPPPRPRRGHLHRPARPRGPRSGGVGSRPQGDLRDGGTDTQRVRAEGHRP